MNLAERAANLLGVPLQRYTEIAGGDLSQVMRVAFEDGRTAIVKGGPAPEVEARMLDAIGATGAPAPAVLGYDDKALVIEELPANGQLSDAWRDLGRVLSRLHSMRSDTASSSGAYGWDDDYAFGKVSIENEYADDWTTFWAERRLANQASFLPTELGVRLEALAAALEQFLPSAPPRVLLHGDLWGGNVLAANERISGLIDPACYYGDREVDIAMLRLFNQPGRELFAEYEALEPGHEERLAIYQLWPALVHFRLFGSTYRSMVERMLASVGF